MVAALMARTRSRSQSRNHHLEPLAAHPIRCLELRRQRIFNRRVYLRLRSRGARTSPGVSAPHACDASRSSPTAHRGCAPSPPAWPTGALRRHGHHLAPRAHADPSRHRRHRRSHCCQTARRLGAKSGSPASRRSLLSRAIAAMASAGSGKGAAERHTQAAESHGERQTPFSMPFASPCGRSVPRSAPQRSIPACSPLPSVSNIKVTSAEKRPTPPFSA